MAFPNSSDVQTVSRTGQRNQTGDNFALFRDLFSGEVLTAFHKQNIMMGRHRVKTITKGKSYDFPLVGTAGAGYHTPGARIEGQKLNHQYRKVTIDKLLVAPVFIDKLDEALTEYDIRSIYTSEVGKTLANLADRNILRVAAKAASIDNKTKATAAGLAVLTDETYVSNVTLTATTHSAVTGKMIYQSILNLRKERDMKGITGTPTLYLSPEHYYKLLDVDSVQSAVWLNSDVGGAGSTSGGLIRPIAGVNVVMAPNMPSTDESSALAGSDPMSDMQDYKGNFSKLVGILMEPDAVCTVKVFDLQTEGEYQIERQGHLIVAKLT